MDWNNDGRVDLILGHRDGNIRIYLNSGTSAAPVFTSYTDLKVGGSTYDCGYTAVPYIVDWNNDGKKDVLCGADNGYTYLLLNTGTDASPSFSSATMISGVSVSGDGGRAAPVAFDWDRDGKKDLLVGNTNGTIRFFRNAGTDASPVFSTSSLLAAGGSTLDLYLYTRFDVADWNNDGVPDIISGEYYGNVWLYLGNDPVPPSNISGVVWCDADKDGQKDPGETGMGGVTVFIDADGDGQYDPPAAQAFIAADVPKSILDSQSVTSTLSVPAGVGAVLDINVTLSITHTYDADLEVLLTSPAGTSIRLFSGVGSSGDNFTGTTLDDEAATPISSGSAPFSGSYQPQQLLSAFDGQTASGTWTLTVTDNFGGDQGTLTAWSLTIQSGEASRQTLADGSFLFADVEPGEFSVRQVVPTGHVQTYPAAGGHDFQLNPGQSRNDVNFGNWQDSIPPEIVAWSSASTHCGVGEILLSIPDDGTFCEPRSTGIHQLVVQFSEAIGPGSFAPSSVQIAGQDVNGNALDLSGITITTSLRNGNIEGVIDFSQPLPNVARYVVRVQGVTDVAGNALAGDDDRIISAMAGDATGDGAVDACDYISLKRAFGSSVSLTNGSLDLDCSGKVDCADLMALAANFGQSLNMSSSAPELPARAASAAPSTTGALQQIVKEPAVVVAEPEPGMPPTGEPIAAAAKMAELSVELPSASSSLQAAAGILDALAHSGPLIMAIEPSRTRPSYAKPTARFANDLGPLATFPSPLLSRPRACQIVADVLQLAGPWWSGGSAGYELPDEPWMARLAPDIAAKPRKNWFGIVDLDILVAGR